MNVEWASTRPLPQVHDRVLTCLNGLGEGVVTGYWAEGQYLGIRVKLDAPPAWYLTQHKGENPEGIFFGPEIRKII